MGLSSLAGIGILLIIMGLLELPHGVMKLNANKLSLSGVEEKVESKALRLVEIENDRIILIDSQDRVIKQELLNLSPSTANVIEQYLRTHIGSESLVKNRVG